MQGKPRKETHMFFLFFLRASDRKKQRSNYKLLFQSILFDITSRMEKPALSAGFFILEAGRLHHFLSEAQILPPWQENLRLGNI